MPVCTSCTYPVQHLYTTYRTKSNIRLGVCPRCSAFLDPLIEHPTLVLLLDLILLKPRVFLHLIYNRGSLPLDATRSTGAAGAEALADCCDAVTSMRQRVMEDDLLRLASTTILAESVVRLRSHMQQPLDMAALQFGRLLGSTAFRVVLELAGQYVTTTALVLIILRFRGWWICGRSGLAVRPRSDDPGAVDGVDGRKQNFQPIMIPLTLLYTSILPLLLHLVLGIWYSPSSAPHAVPETISTLSVVRSLPGFILDRLPSGFIEQLDSITQAIIHIWRNSDRIWAGTRLLGGMSAGFGLRIVLPTKPWETTAVVLAGWAASAWVGHVWQASNW